MNVVTGSFLSFEAWLVVDKDQWTDKQLSQLHHWSQQADNFGFALSNPKFEFWLLLHFEDGAGISSSKNCSQRLERYLPGYIKGIDIRKITRVMISDACGIENLISQNQYIFVFHSSRSASNVEITSC